MNEYELRYKVQFPTSRAHHYEYLEREGYVHASTRQEAKETLRLIGLDYFGIRVNFPAVRLTKADIE